MKLFATIAVVAILSMQTGPSIASLCTLRSISGPVIVEEPNSTVSNLLIDGNEKPALVIRNAGNVTVRNLLIRHRGARGIEIHNSPGLTIENIVVVSEVPTSGPHKSSTQENIYAYGSAGLTLTNARLYGGSSGVYLLESTDSQLKNLYGEDFRGPFPRGQFVQFDKSHRSTLAHFHTRSFSYSWPEDNINIFQSNAVSIRNGLIDGNNAPNGVGVIFDGGNATGEIVDVDAVHMGNGAFSAYAAGGTGESVRFIRTRARDAVCTDQGRGKPASGGTVWTGHPDLTKLQITESTHFNACHQIVWPRSAFTTIDLVQQEFDVQTIKKPSMCWEQTL